MSATAAAPALPTFKTMLLSRPAEGVVMLKLHRPRKLNAFSDQSWSDLKAAFGYLAGDATCRAIVLAGSGKCFTAGLDLVDAAGLMAGNDDLDASRQGWIIRHHVLRLQDAVTSPELCPQPVIAAIHGACIGAGIDLSTACDIRMCASDAFFAVKEVDIGLAADVGTLQRLPKVVGNQSLIRDWAYTARRFDAGEAARAGLVSRVSGAGAEAVQRDAVALASLIASKSPVAVTGTKRNLLFSRDNTVAASLQFVAAWNAGFVQSDDVGRAVGAFFEKTKPVFAKL